MRKTQYKYVSDGCDPKDAHSLDQFFGRKKQLNTPFKNVKELEASLKGMNLVDMQKLAIELGIKPCADRIRLVRACVDQFNRLTKTYGLAKQNIDLEKEFDPANIV